MYYLWSRQLFVNSDSNYHYRASSISQTLLAYYFFFSQTQHIYYYSHITDKETELRDIQVFAKHSPKGNNEMGLTPGFSISEAYASSTLIPAIKKLFLKNTSQVGSNLLLHLISYFKQQCSCVWWSFVSALSHYKSRFMPWSQRAASQGSLPWPKKSRTGIRRPFW